VIALPNLLEVLVAFPSAFWNDEASPTISISILRARASS
jgi:hypothetical protein